MTVLLFIALHTQLFSLGLHFLWLKSNIREDQFVVKIFAQRSSVSIVLGPCHAENDLRDT